MKKFDVIIIGSGPSGLMASKEIKGKSVLVIEKNDSLGGKIIVSGNGRCNVTNNKNIDELISHIPHNGKFLYSSLSKFNSQHIIEFFYNNGVSLKEEDNNRIFPKSNKSLDIVDALLTDEIEYLTNYEVKTIHKDNNIFVVNNHFCCNYLVVATGGNTYPNLGTTGDGYEFAKLFNHSITKLFACETPIVSNDSLIQSKELQGISFKNAKITLNNNNKKLKVINNDIIITHFGISGPGALLLSYYIGQNLDSELKIDIQIPEDQIPKKARSFFNNEILSIDIHGLRGFNHGFVTSGGINIKEIHPNSFMSKNEENLFFIGEVIDVNAHTGGYNITICLSMGNTCANFINNHNL